MPVRRRVRLRLSRLGLTSVTVGAIVAALVGFDLSAAAGTPGAEGPNRSAGEVSSAPSPAGVRAARGPVDAPVPVLHWAACGDLGSNLQCARARVPLDYDRPNGPTIRLGLARIPATNPVPSDRRTLFVNPGGPGGSSTQSVEDIASALGVRIRRHFDIVGIDPRGVNASAPMRCRIPDPAPRAPIRAFPMTPDEVTTQLRSDRYLRKACRLGGNPIVDHMSTADTARDMDLIRQAVGDPKLTYYGISYGTFLGATYAAMFPRHVRALITDAVLDPVAWSTGRFGRGTKVPFSARLGSGEGANDAMVTALLACNRVGKQRCAFAGKALAKWERLTDRLRDRPLRLPDGTSFHYAELIGYTLGSMYDRASYRPMMRNVAMIYDLTFNRTRSTFSTADARGLRAHIAAVDREQPYAGYGPVLSNPFAGVACADTLNPRDPRRWIRAGINADRAAPGYGRLWSWASSPCASWPGSSADAYRGPYRKNTANPVLIIGNAHDPATPVSGARALHAQLRNSRLFTLNTWGHGALGQSRCATTRFADYLIDGALPREDSVCPADRLLYPR